MAQVVVKHVRVDGDLDEATTNLSQVPGRGKCLYQIGPTKHLVHDIPQSSFTAYSTVTYGTVNP